MGDRTRLHPDFQDLRIVPGGSSITKFAERFDITNITALGAGIDVHPHVPMKVGQVGTAVFWESTGAADALPFWNTNLRGDVLLFLISGEVRIEFKELEGSERYGSYEGRSGDLMLLPKDIAHRTYSGNGKRRVSLEIIEHDPRWDSLDWVGAVQPDLSLRLDDLSVRPDGPVSELDLGGSKIVTDSSFLLRGARALVAYGGHLGHNEFEGGFVVCDDDGDEVVLKVAGNEMRADRKRVVAWLKGVIVTSEQAGEKN